MLILPMLAMLMMDDDEDDKPWTISVYNIYINNISRNINNKCPISEWNE